MFNLIPAEAIHRLGGEILIKAIANHVSSNPVAALEKFLKRPQSISLFYFYHLSVSLFVIMKKYFNLGSVS